MEYTKLTLWNATSSHERRKTTIDHCYRCVLIHCRIVLTIKNTLPISYNNLTINLTNTKHRTKTTKTKYRAKHTVQHHKRNIANTTNEISLKNTSHRNAGNNTLKLLTYFSITFTTTPTTSHQKPDYSNTTKTSNTTLFLVRHHTTIIWWW